MQMRRHSLAQESQRLLPGMVVSAGIGCRLAAAGADASGYRIGVAELGGGDVREQDRVAGVPLILPFDRVRMHCFSAP